MDSQGLAQRRPRVDRREAARILQCSRDNIRRLDKNGTLRSGRRDVNGAFTYDRREIEKLAHERGQKVKATGELAARVFAMFKARKRFEDIVIETEQEPPAILALWRYYKSGFEFDGAAPETEEAAQTEHESQMRAMDRELDKRRRLVAR
jgi:DNA-binding transcriptional MerR regulator